MADAKSIHKGPKVSSQCDATNQYYGECRRLDHCKVVRRVVYGPEPGTRSARNLSFFEPERFEINFSFTGTGILESYINFVHERFFAFSCQYGIDIVIKLCYFIGTIFLVRNFGKIFLLNLGTGLVRNKNKS